MSGLNEFDPNSEVVRPTWAVVHLDNLIHNFRIMKRAAAGAAVLAALKADAYGHGAVECARALEKEGAGWFGVAFPEEGLSLRASGVRGRILCLGGFWEGQEAMLVQQALTPVICRADLLGRLDRAARAAGTIVGYHLKVDTGMGRLGVPWTDLAQFLEAISAYKNVRLEGLMTHFSCAGDPEKVDFTVAQINMFESALDMVRSRGHDPAWIHLANSAAAHAFPQARGNLVRLGGLLYGLWRDVTNPDLEPFDWRPVMSLHTRIAFLKKVPAGTSLGYGGTFVTGRDTFIATLPIGYDDGLPTSLSNRASLLVQGRFAPIVGRISMDLTLVDVTDISGVSTGDEVVIFGSQGRAFQSVEELASRAGFLSYEITCGISYRVPRVYFRADTAQLQK